MTGQEKIYLQNYVENIMKTSQNRVATGLFTHARAYID